jgi:hypothetical protein
MEGLYRCQEIWHLPACAPFPADPQPVETANFDGAPVILALFATLAALSAIASAATYTTR